MTNSNAMDRVPQPVAPANRSTPSATTPAPKVDSFEVGWLFVQEYYTFVNKDPKKLHQFYDKRSFFLHGQEGEPAKMCHGQAEIYGHIVKLGFEDCKVLVSNVDSQESLNGGIIVQVLGEMSNRGLPCHKFAQTFFLAEQPNGYYVLNDIFRFLKEDIDNDYELTPEPDAKPVHVEDIYEEQLLPVAIENVISEPLLTHRHNHIQDLDLENIHSVVANETVSLEDQVVSSDAVSQSSWIPTSPERKHETPASAPESSVAPSTPAPSTITNGVSATAAPVSSQTVPATPPKPSASSARAVSSNSTATSAAAPSPQQSHQSSQQQSQSQPAQPSQAQSQQQQQQSQQQQSSRPNNWAGIAASGSHNWGLQASPAKGQVAAVSPPQPSKQQQAPTAAPSAPVQLPVQPSPLPTEESQDGSVRSADVSGDEASKENQFQTIQRNRNENRRPDHRGAFFANGSQDEKEKISVYVRSIPEGTTKAQIKDAFSRAGTVKMVDLVPSKNIAFVEFNTAEVAQKAIGQSFTLKGVTVVAEERRKQGPQRQRPTYGGRGGGESGGFYERGGFRGGRGGHGRHRGSGDSWSGSDFNNGGQSQHPTQHPRGQGQPGPADRPPRQGGVKPQ